MDAPALEQECRVLQCVEDFAVEQCVLESAGGAFVVSVFPRSYRLDIGRLYPGSSKLVTARSADRKTSFGAAPRRVRAEGIVARRGGIATCITKGFHASSETRAARSCFDFWHRLSRWARCLSFTSDACLPYLSTILRAKLTRFRETDMLDCNLATTVLDASYRTLHPHRSLSGTARPEQPGADF